MQKGEWSMLRLTRVSKHFSEKQVIASVTLLVKAGEMVCFTGPSGIGKTTLLEMIAGVIPADNGTIERHSVPALMFQDDVLMPWLTALANIKYIMPDNLPQGVATDIARDWLAFFELQEAIFPADMSGGMRRRLSLARTFASGRKLLLMDEPFAFLDEAWQEKIAKEIAAFAAKGSSIILTSHTTGFMDLPCFIPVPFRVFSLTESPITIV